ncbi:MAG: hypothetical protein ACP5H3_00190 [Candidatus Aenigmatarchaeota archaeon]
MVKIKAVSEIISVVMIVVISIGLISAAYMYGYPLIQKSQDKPALEKAISFFDIYNPSSLPKRIEFIANNGGEDSLTLDTQGIWEVHPYDENSNLNNSIIFYFFTKVTNIKSNQFISLTPGGECPPKEGIVGSDTSYVVCIKGEPIFDGINITYAVFFRGLKAPSGETYKIALTTQDGVLKRSTGKTLRIIRDSIDKLDNQIITKIKIILS